jgi:hypothetical protein
MDFKYKKIKKDWTSRDSRFHYRKGDEVMVLKEDDKYHTVALDVAIVGSIPNEYFDDGDELKDAGVLGLVYSKFTKDLLLKDLCARLPYGVKAQYYGSEEEMLTVDTIEAIYVQPSVEIVIGQYGLGLDDVKPYLRDMDDMTEEEEKELEETLCWGQYSPLSYEFFYVNHINFRLPNDMFIRVTEDNNPYKINVQ